MFQVHTRKLIIAVQAVTAMTSMMGYFCSSLRWRCTAMRTFSLIKIDPSTPCVNASETMRCHAMLRPYTNCSKSKPRNLLKHISATELNHDKTCNGHTNSKARHALALADI